MENIDRERIVVFIGISLLLSLIVNWQSHKLNNAFYTYAVEGWKRFQSFSSFPCGRTKQGFENRAAHTHTKFWGVPPGGFHCVFS